MPAVTAPQLLRISARPLSRVVYVLAGSMALCAPAAFMMGQPFAGWKMLLTASIVAAAGVGLQLVGRSAAGRIGRREAMVVVSLAWLAAGIFGGLPFVISNGVGPVDAFFESVSGFTTTGATILTDIEGTLDPATHLWRAGTHWLGGLGIVMLFVALFPALGVGGKHLFKTEAAGPPSGALMPRIRDTARSLWRIYLAVTLAEVGALMLAGMSVFESAVHAMSTLGTGGFSTRNGSVADFHSVWIDVIITVFMVAAGGNFGLYHEALQRGWRALFRNVEFRVYVGLVVVSSLIIALDLTRSVYVGDPLTALRYSSFQVASIITTTGLGTADFEQWPGLSQSILVVLYFIGGSAGSTAGGIKVIRLVIIVQVIINEARRSARPALVTTVRVGRKAVTPQIVREVLAYVVLFTLTFAAGAVVVAAIEPKLDAATAFMSSLACIANVGPGLGDVGPTDNYGFFTPASKVVLSLLMYVGRLEGFAILAVFVPRFWRR